MIIEKNDELPVWLTRSDEEDVIYIRKDGQSVIAHGEQIEKMFLNSKRIPFDKIVLQEKYHLKSFTTLNGLYKKQTGCNKDITIKQLQSIEAVSLNKYITNALNLFSDDYNGHNCNITCRIWPGLTKGSSIMLDRKSFKGNILNLLLFAKNYIFLYSKQGLEKYDSGGRGKIISYPERAVEEALVNAIAHRDYYIDGAQIDLDIFINRLQISSPGSFLFPGNAQDYQMDNIPSRRRNEIVCAVLDLCQLMEQSGSGFEKILESYKSYDENFKPTIYSDPSQFIITLKDLTYNPTGELKVENEDISFDFKPPKNGNREYDLRILKYCFDEPKSRQEIQSYLELYDRKNFINSILRPLIESELLLATQQSLNAPNQKYFTNKDKITIK